MVGGAYANGGAERCSGELGAGHLNNPPDEVADVEGLADELIGPGGQELLHVRVTGQAGNADNPGVRQFRMLANGPSDDVPVEPVTITRIRRAD